MTAIGEGAFSSAPLGLEYVLVVTMLAFMALVTYDGSIASQLRRQMMMTSAPLTEAMKGLVDLFFDIYRRTARIVGHRHP